AVGSQFAGDQIEERRLTRAVRPDDQPALPGFDREGDIGGDAQAPKGFAQGRDGERGHGRGSAKSTVAARVRSSFRPACHSRTDPGTSPSGMNEMMATKIRPSTRFQRAIQLLTMVLVITTITAPATGPSSVPLPPEITIKRTSADACKPAACGL